MSAQANIGTPGPQWAGSGDDRESAGPRAADNQPPEQDPRRPRAAPVATYHQRVLAQFALFPLIR